MEHRMVLHFSIIGYYESSSHFHSEYSDSSDSSADYGSLPGVGRRS